MHFRYSAPDVLASSRRASRPTEGLLVVFSLSTWVLRASIAGIFLSAIVLKRAGNITVIFASSVAWITSCIVSVPWLGLYEIATPIFWLGVVLIALATFVYEVCALCWRRAEETTQMDPQLCALGRRRRGRRGKWCETSAASRRPSSLGIEMDAADGGVPHAQFLTRPIRTMGCLLRSDRFVIRSQVWTLARRCSAPAVLWEARRLLPQCSRWA